jgi:PPK2 family polyphosphate:nucleotide phosphotransferase
MNLSDYRYNGEGNFKLSKIDPGSTGKYESKEHAMENIQNNIQKMIEQQDKLYAEGDYSLLIIIQAMDTAGKDGLIKHVMSGLNPQGTRVYGFKQPSNEDLAHDYLWRSNKCLPERGKIGIFNRSYYEEVLVVKVHNLINEQKIPKKLINEDIWKDRYNQIKDYEKYLYKNGIIPVKIYLHISKEEQKRRLLERIDDKTKNWKFSEADMKERNYWHDYLRCYEELILETGTKYAPWYVIPSDQKWFSRLVVSNVIYHALKKLNLKYPEVSEEQLKVLENCKNSLLKE